MGDSPSVVAHDDSDLRVWFMLHHHKVNSQNSRQEPDGVGVVCVITAFGVGCAVAFGAFVYSTIDLARTMEPRPNETTIGRFRYRLSKVIWWRVVATTVAGGLLAVVLWHGLGGVLAAVARWSS